MYTVGSDSFGNGTESARRAGYKGNDNTLSQTAIKLVRNGRIIAEKQRIQAETSKNIDLDRDAIIKRFVSIANSAQANNGDKLRANENLAKIIGLYEADNRQRTDNIQLMTAVEWAQDHKVKQLIDDQYNDKDLRGIPPAFAGAGRGGKASPPIIF